MKFLTVIAVSLFATAAMAQSQAQSGTGSTGRPDCDTLVRKAVAVANGSEDEAGSSLNITETVTNEVLHGGMSTTYRQNCDGCRCHGRKQLATSDSSKCRRMLHQVSQQS